ncbi:MAG: hypothetical protein AMXMBFR7_01740 [Planctomycetota bacterium]
MTLKNWIKLRMFETAPNPKARMYRASRGFTLVEILATLAILLIGLGAIISMLLGTGREGGIASDRNAAALMITEATRGIEREHLITLEMALASGIDEEHVGKLIQTPPDAVESDDNAIFGSVQITGPVPSDPAKPNGPVIIVKKPLSSPFTDATVSPPMNKGFPPLPLTSINEWPRRPFRPFQIGSGQYRVRYRLEKHPEWWPLGGVEIPHSNLRGLYLLTLVVYLDEAGDMSNPVQISDPVTVLLRDRVVR